MTAQETFRQFYLGVAGIRMWYAKRPLPGAAPSPEYRFGHDAGAVERDIGEHLPGPGFHQAPVKASHKSPRQKAVDLKALMAPETSEQEAPTNRSVPDVRDASEETQSGSDPVVAGVQPTNAEPGHAVPVRAEEVVARPLVACHLGIWSTDDYLLISQWSEETSERLQDSLARNLLKALGQSQVENRQVLHWPVFRNPDMPGNSTDDFRDVLAHVLSAQQRGSVILLGVLREEREDHRHYCLEPILSQVGMDFAHSLAGLSTTPGYKRDLWSALKSRYLV